MHAGKLNSPSQLKYAPCKTYLNAQAHDSWLEFAYG